MCTRLPTLRSTLPVLCFFFNDTATTEIYTLSLHDALPIWAGTRRRTAGYVEGVASMQTLPWLTLSLAASACASEHGPLTNRMAQSTTHYLTRAARQPVSWQPWGREAFALAARLDRPILLYVGAEECRWCAVMDREVYGDLALGAMIDSLFVPVRVDRDERPDVAQRYEAAVQWLAGLRGYPVTVFLTPDGSAFFGGTYFPADDPVTGRGLKQLLPEVAKSYREQRGVIVQRSEEHTSELQSRLHLVCRLLLEKKKLVSQILGRHHYASTSTAMAMGDNGAPALALIGLSLLYLGMAHYEALLGALAVSVAAISILV